MSRRDRPRTRPGAFGDGSVSPWQAARTCSSSAAAAGARCRRTSPSARTAATGCASARRSSSAAGTPKAPKAPRRRPSLGRLKPGEMPGIRGERRPYATILLVLAAIVVTILFNAGRVLPRRPRARRGRHRRVLAHGHDAVRLQPERATRSWCWRPSSCSAGCSSAGTARGRRCSCSSLGGAGGMALAIAGRRRRPRARRQRRRAGAARRVGRARPARPPPRRGGRLGHARRAGDRRRARAAAARRGGGERRGRPRRRA